MYGAQTNDHQDGEEGKFSYQYIGRTWNTLNSGWESRSKQYGVGSYIEPNNKLRWDAFYFKKGFKKSIEATDIMASYIEVHFSYLKIKAWEAYRLYWQNNKLDLRIPQVQQNTCVGTLVVAHFLGWHYVSMICVFAPI